MALTEQQINSVRSRANQLRNTQPQKKTTPGGFFGEALETGLGVAKGAGKGVLSTARGTLSLLERTGSKISGIPVSEKGTLAEQEVSQDLITPIGGAEKVGMFTEQLAEFLVPAGTIAKLGKSAQTIIKATQAGKLGEIAGVGAKIGIGGAGFTGIGALQEGKVDKNMATTAFAVETLSPVLGKILKPLANTIKGLPDRLITSALGTNKKQILQDLKSGKNSLSQFVLKNKPALSTANTLIKDSSANIERLSNTITQKLKSSVRKTGGLKTIGRDNLFDIVVKTPEAKNANLNRLDIRDTIERLVPQSRRFLEQGSLTLEEANKLRQILDKTLGDRGFLADKLPADKEILKNTANILREQIKTKAPEGVRGLFDDLSMEIRLHNTVLEKLAQKSGNEIINLGDLIVGGAFGFGGGGIGGSLIAAGTLRILRSIPFKIASAKTIQFINQNVSKLETLSPQAQATIIKIIDSAFSRDENQLDNQ